MSSIVMDLGPAIDNMLMLANHGHKGAKAEFKRLWLLHSIYYELLTMGGSIVDFREIKDNTYEVDIVSVSVDGYGVYNSTKTYTLEPKHNVYE